MIEHAEFQIGTEFFTETGRWRCTDIGSRVIVAISLEPRETVSIRRDASGNVVEERYISDDVRDLNGPPYSIAEHVFDEDDFEGLYRTADEVPA